MTGTALILGASGRFGRNAAEAFWNAGWRVREFDRAADDLMTASQNVDVIVNGWNPPYTKWACDVPPMTRQVIAAAEASGATVILPGNIYGYGQGSGPTLDENTPMTAQNPLGRIRIDMEAAYRAAACQTIILRAGDYIDTEASGNWFDQIITAKAAKGRVTSPGDPTIPHTWAYLPDLARAAVALAEKRAQLQQFEEVLYPGYTLSLDDICALVAEATGRPQQLKKLNWLPIQIAAPVWPMGRALLEMRYLWNMPHRLDGTGFDALLPRFNQTDALTAVTRAVRHLDIHPNQTVSRSKTHVVTQ